MMLVGNGYALAAYDHQRRQPVDDRTDFSLILMCFNATLGKYLLEQIEFTSFSFP
jgi:hypothetical protein